VSETSAFGSLKMGFRPLNEIKQEKLIFETRIYVVLSPKL
jgi:hypothetical protein